MPLYDIAPLAHGRQPLFTYGSPHPLRRGQVVTIPYGPRQELGVVWADGTARAHVKDIVRAYDVTLSPAQCDLAQFIAAEYAAPLGVALKGFVPPLRQDMTASRPSAPVRSLSGIREVWLGSDRLPAYRERVKRCVAASQSVLWLVPEVTGATAHLANLPTTATYHSGLADVERRRVWQKVAEDEPIVVVGTRSALLLPWSNLGLIILDEEDDLSYKNESSPRWHARSVASRLAQLTTADLLIGSVAPSLETWRTVQEGVFQDVVTPRDAKVATTFIAPHGRDLVGHQITELIENAAAQARRVAIYAPLQRRIQLSEELRPVAATVKHLSFYPENAVSAELVLQEYRKAPTLIAGGPALARFWHYDADVMVVLGIDAHLQLPDFRANEKAHALLRRLHSKVAPGGSLIIQTQTPEHSALAALQEPFAAWAAGELAERKLLQLPPWKRLTRVIFTGKTARQAAKKAAAKLATHAITGISVSESPLPNEQGARWHVLIKGDPKALQGLLHPTWTVDIDPLTLF